MHQGWRDGEKINERVGADIDKIEQRSTTTWLNPYCLAPPPNNNEEEDVAMSSLARWLFIIIKVHISRFNHP